MKMYINVRKINIELKKLNILYVLIGRVDNLTRFFQISVVFPKHF